MAVSTSRLAFSDCFDLMEKAVNDPKGIQVKFATYEDAFHFRLRIHSARKIDRADNLEAYAEGHKMHGRSVYDQLTLRIRKADGVAWLRLERIDAREFEVESLSEAPREPELSLTSPVPMQIQEVKPILKLRRRF